MPPSHSPRCPNQRIPLFRGTRTPRTTRPGAPHPTYLPFLFGGVLIVSITVVFGRRLASLMGMNSPLMASRPIFRVPIRPLLIRRRAYSSPLRTVWQWIRLLPPQCTSDLPDAQPPVEVRLDKGPLFREARAPPLGGVSFPAHPTSWSPPVCPKYVLRTRCGRSWTTSASSRKP